MRTKEKGSSFVLKQGEQVRATYKKCSNESRYEELKGKRSEFESRSLRYAQYTLPTLLSSYESGSGETSPKHGWQGTGAQCVNHLANKIALTLFPAQTPFFAVDVNTKGEEELKKAGFSKLDLTKVFAGVASNAVSIAENTAFRAAIVEAMKHLIVTGNVCLRLPVKDEEKVQAIPLPNYVVKRDMSGNMIDFVLLENKSLNTFDPEMQMLIRAARSPQKLKEDEDIKLYTRAKLCNDGKIDVSQSAWDIPVGRVHHINKEDVPFLPVTWKRNYGEDYGRGLVEDHEGDFFVVKFLSETQARGMALMADVKFLVKPGALTDINKLIKARSGDVLFGNEADIHILQLGKYADFTPIKAVLDEYIQRLGQVFMLASLIRRDAERVTAYEVRSDALELEQGLGGIYSLFAEQVQRPMAMWFIGMVESNVLDKIQPIIITGIAALGQMAELEKLNQLSELLAAPNTWAPQFQQLLKPDGYLKWALAQLSMDAPFFKTVDEVNQENKEAIQDERNAQMDSQVVGEAAKAIPNMITQGE